MGLISRRGFLKTSAVAATASAVGKVSAAGANERIGAAVIGCRNRGRNVAGAFHGTGRFDLVTICDCDQAMIDDAMKKLGKNLPRQPRQVKDFQRVLDDKDIDAIINATPDHWHAQITNMALQAGKHVYLEKPASHNINEGKAMVAVQKKHPNLIVLVGSQQRSGQHFKDAKEFIDSGALGKIGFCRAWITNNRQVIPRIPDSAPPKSLDYDMWIGPAPYRPYNENRVHYNWRFIKDYGTGETANWGAHMLDVVRWYMDIGFPKSVSAFGGQHVVKDAKEWPDTQTIIYEYPELTVLWEQRSWTGFKMNGTDCGVEFDGHKGSLVISRQGWTFYPKGGKPVEHGKSDLSGAHVRNFADSIQGSARPAASIEEGRKTATMCHLGNIAVAVNRRLEFDAKTQTIKNVPEADKYMGRQYRKPWKLPT